MTKTLLPMLITLAALTVGLRAQNPLADASPNTPPQSRPEQKPDDKKAPLSIAGKWTMALNMAMGQSTPALELKQSGEKITGTYTGRYGTFPLEGTLKDRAIELHVRISVESETVNMWFKGEVAADAQTMKGDADLGQAGDATWTAARTKDK
jgi:hypothetical protein